MSMSAHATNAALTTRSAAQTAALAAKGKAAVRLCVCTSFAAQVLWVVWFERLHIRHVDDGACSLHSSALHGAQWHSSSWHAQACIARLTSVLLRSACGFVSSLDPDNRHWPVLQTCHRGCACASLPQECGHATMCLWVIIVSASAHNTAERMATARSNLAKASHCVAHASCAAQQRTNCCLRISEPPCSHRRVSAIAAPPS